MKIRNLILEGRYDKITGTIVKDMMRNIIGAYTKSGTQENPKKYKGTEVRTNKKITDIESYIIRRDSFIELGDYSDDVSGLMFSVEFAILFSQDVRESNPYIQGFAINDDDFATIQIHVGINPNDGTGILSKIQAELRDVVRHEIEHLTQSGFNELPGKKRNHNFKQREKIANNPDQAYKYAILSNEIEPMLQGLYSKAKTTKKPFNVVVRDYLQTLIDDYGVTEKQTDIIYNKWKSAAKKIGGLPQL